jgi:hypothetical protein
MWKWERCHGRARCKTSIAAVLWYVCKTTYYCKNSVLPWCVLCVKGFVSSKWLVGWCCVFDGTPCSTYCVILSGRKIKCLETDVFKVMSRSGVSGAWTPRSLHAHALCCFDASLHYSDYRLFFLFVIHLCLFEMGMWIVLLGVVERSDWYVGRCCVDVPSLNLNCSIQNVILVTFYSVLGFVRWLKLQSLPPSESSGPFSVRCRFFFHAIVASDWNRNSCEQHIAALETSFAIL